MTNDPVSVLFGVGRLVQGSLYQAQDKDDEGRPRVYEAGHPKAGQPKISYYFAVAIEKAGTTHWASAPWGKQVWDVGHAAWPNLVDRAAGYITLPTFAWKIEDGDSTTPNQNGRKNCEREGYPGNWIAKFSSGFAPKIVDTQGNPILEPGHVKTGYYVEVLASVKGNDTAKKPGVYLNHNGVAFRGFGKEIMSGPDLRAVGFGRSALPTGASAAPVGTAAMPSTVGAAPPPAPGIPGGNLPGQTVAVAPPAPLGAIPGIIPGVPTAVAPAPSFVSPGAVSMPPAPAPAASVGPRLKPEYESQGWTYAGLVAKGWNDASMRQAGYMA